MKRFMTKLESAAKSGVAMIVRAPCLVMFVAKIFCFAHSRQRLELSGI
jgi:hypothetical protein